MVTLFCYYLLYRLINYLKNDWWVVTVLKNIESAPGKPFLKSTTPPNYTLKGVDRPLHFENCSAGPDGRCASAAGSGTAHDQLVV